MTAPTSREELRAMIHRLLHVATTAANDDISKPGTMERHRHVIRDETIHEVAEFLETLTDTGFAQTALDGRSYDAALEAAAQICEKPIGIQHPMKPVGVTMSTAPPSPHHANVIRGMKGSPEPSTDRGGK